MSRKRKQHKRKRNVHKKYYYRDNGDDLPRINYRKPNIFETIDYSIRFWLLVIVVILLVSFLLSLLGKI